MIEFVEGFLEFELYNELIELVDSLFQGAHKNGGVAVMEVMVTPLFLVSLR